MTYSLAHPGVPADPTFRPRGSGARSPVRPVEAGLVLIVLGVVGFVAVAVSFPLAGALYAAFYVALSLVRPGLALVLTLTAAPFVHDLGVGPVKLSIAELNLVLGLIPAWVMARGVTFRSPFWVPAILYMVVCLFSTLMHGLGRADVVAFVQMGVYLFLVTFYFSQLQNDPPVLKAGLAGLLATDCVLAVVVAVAGSNYVLGYHKNAIGSQMGIAVIAALGLWWHARGRVRWALSAALAVTAAGLLLSLSRGAWVGTAAAVGVMLMLRGAWRQTLRIGLLAAPVLATAWLSLPEEQREYATSVDTDRRNIQARYDNAAIAFEQFKANPILGVGVGFRKQADATNLFLFTLAETGVVGFLAFVLVVLAFASMVWRTWRRLPAAHPFFPLFVIGTGLMVGKFGHAMFDHYWQRGLLPVWAGAGMVCRAYQLALRQPTAAQPPDRPRRAAGTGGRP